MDYFEWMKKYMKDVYGNDIWKKDYHTYDTLLTPPQTPKEVVDELFKDLNIKVREKESDIK